MLSLIVDAFSGTIADSSTTARGIERNFDVPVCGGVYGGKSRVRLDERGYAEFEKRAIERALSLAVRSAVKKKKFLSGAFARFGVRASVFGPSHRYRTHNAIYIEYTDIYIHTHCAR